MRVKIANLGTMQTMQINMAGGIGKSAIAAKWGEVALGGFQPVPDLLLKNQAALGLSPIELAVLLNVLMHWWYPEQKPFPRPTTIARRMGVTVRTVQRVLSDLQAAGILTRVRSDGATYLDPTPLVNKLGELALSDPDFLLRKERLAT